jgi:hypothetical protein
VRRPGRKKRGQGIGNVPFRKVEPMTKADRDKELARVVYSLINWVKSGKTVTQPANVIELDALKDRIAELFMDAPKKKPKVLMPMPEGFGLTDKLREWAKAGGVKDPGMTMGAFKDYHLSKGNVFADWDKAFQTWCRNEVRGFKKR